jgi:Cys-tRNA(Pro) deacylase
VPVKADVPATAAVRALRAAGIEFEPRLYAYVERGGTKHSAEALGVDEHAVVKTLVMESRGREGRPQPLIVLMHGDREVSTKELARQIGAREVAPATSAAVEKHTGYVPGGVSPFGTRVRLPVYVEETILALDRFLINGGRRGFLVEIAPADLERVLAPVPVRVAIESRHG